MKAVLSKVVGGPETLVLEELPDPVAGPGQVLIDVKACGVNYPDVLIIEDKYQFKPPRPFAPGGEVSGVIAAVGERLARTDSPYTVLFTQLRALATVAPLPLAEPPVRDMDELLETFGPGADGSEPLLKPRPAGPQPIQFHPRRRQDAQAGH